MNEPQQSIVTMMREAIGPRPAIVFDPNSADGPYWEDLLHLADTPDVLLVALADEKLMSAVGHSRRPSGVTSHLKLQHTIIRELSSGDPPNPCVQHFDRQRRAIVIAPDPLDPVDVGGRDLLGRKSGGARITEHKTVIDSLWDLSGIERAESTVCDLSPRLPSVIAALGHTAGVVLSCQRRGESPQAGAEGLWWSTDGRLPSSFPALDTPDIRLRIMPLLHGLPCRIHGLITGLDTIVFPPLELVSLPRPATGTFQWAGAVPTRTLTPVVLSRLNALTTTVGTWLTHLGHQGAFAVDGIWTSKGFRPTELTPRLTSAFEGAHPKQRVLLHAANLLARTGRQLTCHATLATLAQQALAERIDIYGACPTAASSGQYALEWTPDGPTTSSKRPSTSWLSLTGSPRGRLLHAQLNPAELPTDQPTGALAPKLFALADRLFGTHFGHLIPPFGLEPPYVPGPRAPAQDFGYQH